MCSGKVGGGVRERSAGRQHTAIKSSLNCAGEPQAFASKNDSDLLSQSSRKALSCPDHPATFPNREMTMSVTFAPPQFRNRIESISWPTHLRAAHPPALFSTYHPNTVLVVVFTKYFSPHHGPSLGTEDDKSQSCPSILVWLLLHPLSLLQATLEASLSPAKLFSE